MRPASAGPRSEQRYGKAEMPSGSGHRPASAEYVACAPGARVPSGEGALYSRFYRDPAVMDAVGIRVLFDVAKASLQRGIPSTVRVWCCGCSSGEEVFSLKMLWKDLLEPYFAPYVALEIVGTDISEQQLKICSRARYNPKGMKTLPCGWKERYFESTMTEELVGTDTQSAADHGAGSQAAAQRLVPPAIGMLVTFSSRAPTKLRAVFQKHSSDATGTIADVREGECKVYLESGHVQWCACGKAGVFHLAAPQVSVRRDLLDGITFEHQDVRRQMPAGMFDLVLCRYSAFLYLSPVDAQAALKSIVEALLPGGYLVTGECELLPCAENVPANCLETIPDFSCIHRKVQRANASPQGVAPNHGLRREGCGTVRGNQVTADGGKALPAIVRFETLDDFYVQALGRKGVRSVLGRVPWDSLQKSFLSDASAKIFGASDRPKGSVLTRLAKAEQQRSKSAAALNRLTRCLGQPGPVRRSAYRPALIGHLQDQVEAAEQLRQVSHKAVSAQQLQSFIARMTRDSVRRQAMHGRHKDDSDVLRPSPPRRMRPKSGKRLSRPATAPQRLSPKAGVGNWGGPVFTHMGSKWHDSPSAKPRAPVRACSWASRMLASLQ